MNIQKTDSQRSIKQVTK